ncbi:MAG TPA: hypothetical protein VLA43_21070 [Longimicrobiales bacterium]|nr:hypothetical protein [Longimicrobiales bacterium]
MRFLRRVATGAEAGLLAGAAVALLFLVQDGVQLRLFSTPLALASGLLGSSTVEPDGGFVARVAGFSVLGARIIAYTLVHFFVFAAVGVAGAFVLKVTSFWTSLWGGVVYGSVLCTGLLYGGLWMGDSSVALATLAGMGMPTILLTNAMAGAVLGMGLHLAESSPEDAGDP